MLETLIGGPKLDNLLELQARTENVPGVVVEFGVYKGGALQALAWRTSKLCFGFDTWAGLPPEGWSLGEPHGVGDMRDVDFAEVQAAMPANVRLVRGLFPESAEGFEHPIAFAHVDFDFERCTADAIDWLRPRLSKGAIVVFDDYEWDHCPGVKRAIEAAGIEVQRSTEHQVYWVNDGH